MMHNNVALQWTEDTEQTVNVLTFLSILNKILVIWARGYKTFFVLNSNEHGISTAHTN